MKPILESLLEGKVAWPDIQVSYNSTYANVSSFYFRHVSKKNNHKTQSSCKFYHYIQPCLWHVYQPCLGGAKIHFASLTSLTSKMSS